MKPITKEEVLKYHEGGKIKFGSRKSLKTQRDLSTAYTPAVADVCKEIADNPSKAYDYTNKGNLVAVISNGTAVLGLGNIGVLASKPVMEGKAVLFKTFADIDSINIEVDETDPDKFINVVKAISSTFGGINLEDIKAPQCFEIERKLKQSTDIPIMHDDQHGTAIISTAAIINGLKITNKKAEDVKAVISGAGAAAIACAKMYKQLGIKHIIMFDSKGSISTDRNDLNEYKKEFAVLTDAKSIKDALDGADIFLGLSKPNIINKDDIINMNRDPIIFALSNPVPEICPSEVKKYRDDAIMATGRSDYPNQVNNVLGFPYIFRGALDVRATHITENMKLCAAYALADLARLEVPKELKDIYKNYNLEFGKDYIIPVPFDKRIISFVSPAVAKAAMEDGVARHQVDIDEYKLQLEKRVQK
jgi:malate dehydrogenase (oxaloacetate-decarboxylating)(NADP+)